MKIIQGTDLYPYIHGVLDLSLDETGAVCFHRFTQKQLDRYVVTGKERNMDYFSRAQASSGVTLDLVTDSSMIGMKYRLTAACRAFAGFDCYVDGVFFDHVYTEELAWNVLCFELPEGTHRVQVHFPWSTITVLERVVLDEGAKAEPVAKNCRILTFGDSITQGYITKHPSLSYANSFTRDLNAETVNQAIGGYFFDRDTLDEKLSGFRPDLITVAYGTNDYSLMATPELFKENCRLFTAGLREIFPETKILGLLPIHRNDSRNAARNRMNDFKLEEGRRAIREIFESFPGVTVLEDHYYPRHNDFFAPDCLHPNDLGFTFYANAVTDAIRKLL